MFEPLQKFIKVRAINIIFIAQSNNIWIVYIVQETVEQHEKSRSTEVDIPRDFIDAYLDEVKQQSAKNASTTFTC